MSDAERLRGLEQYKELLQHVMEVYPNKIVFKVTTSPMWIYPSMPEWVTNGGTAYVNKTSSAWDGDAYSTTAKTVIDLSAVFGLPANIKAVAVRMIARDSGSSGATCFFAISPNSTAGHAAVEVYRDKVTNDALDSKEGVCPCDANGDIFYQVAASGTGTLDAWLEIVGYYI